MNPASDWITPQTLLPDLFARLPHLRAVFDRYGLHGCGGREGPRETIRFFSRTHGVDEERLLQELRAGAAAPPPAAAVDADDSPRVDDIIYRRYFTAGIAIALTLGATWGAWLLWKIGFAGKFTGVSIHEVNAHGEAQIFGWVGLFIMGFAYQAFPRMWHTRLAWPALSAAAFAVMIIGLVIRAVGMTFAGASGTTEAALLGGALQIAAATLFVLQILVTFRRSGAALEPYVGFVVAALLFFLLQAMMSVWHTWTTMTAPTRDQLLWYVATYQAPLRDLQIHGMALLMILGVCLRMLPAMYELPRLRRSIQWWMLAVIVLGVIAEVILFIAYRFSGNHQLAAMLMLPWLFLAGGAGVIGWSFKPWRTWRDSDGFTDRSAKFIRTAYLWLAVSMMMLLLLPVHQLLSGIAFSHAYYGAIRHAITVGFISMMIMGFAAKVVATLNGIDPRRLPSLFGPFVLINLGCFLRVATQSLTDLHGGFFGVVGVSGTLEVAALAWWGIGLVRIMRRGKRETATDSTQAAPEIILASHRVADVLRWRPESETVFLKHGFDAIRNPLLRRTVARQVSLSQAAKMRGVDIQKLLNDLNGKPRGFSLPVIEQQACNKE